MLVRKTTFLPFSYSYIIPQAGIMLCSCNTQAFIKVFPRNLLDGMMWLNDKHDIPVLQLGTKLAEAGY